MPFPAAVSAALGAEPFEILKLSIREIPGAASVGNGASAAKARLPIPANTRLFLKPAVILKVDLSLMGLWPHSRGLD